MLGHEFEQALGGDEGQRSLACCSPWGSELDMTEGLNNNNKAKDTEYVKRELFYHELSSQ